MNLESLFELAIPALGFLLLMLSGILLGVIGIVRDQIQFNKKCNDELKNNNS